MRVCLFLLLLNQFPTLFANVPMTEDSIQFTVAQDNTWTPTTLAPYRTDFTVAYQYTNHYQTCNQDGGSGYLGEGLRLDVSQCLNKCLQTNDCVRVGSSGSHNENGDLGQWGPRCYLYSTTQQCTTSATYAWVFFDLLVLPPPPPSPPPPSPPPPTPP